MEKLVKTLLEIKNSKGSYPALMTHVVLGYPTLKTSMEIVRVMVDNGARIIELQIPFSDPMADGPTIMSANEIALKNGVRPKDCLNAISKLSSLPVPLLIMSYYNILLNLCGGLEKGLKAIATSGCEGLIVPDIPPEVNAERYWDLVEKFNLHPIPIVSPLTTDERLRLISKKASNSFLYCSSTTGTTGARKKLALDIKPYLTAVKKSTGLPIAVGFGISTQAHIQALTGLADIAVVGSKTIDLIKQSKKGYVFSDVARFIKLLTSPCP